MKSALPKQFLPLNNKPLIFYAIEKFVVAIPNINVIVVLQVEQFDYWKKICIEFNFSLPHRLVNGGETRFLSVKNGLELVSGDGIVAIHDAVRPLVSQDLIKRAFKAAGDKGNAVPAIELKDSIREVSGNNSKHLERKKFRLVQTPQCFQIQLIKRAYNQLFSPDITDDATLVEQLGEKINLVEGEETNIKITMPFDITVAETLLKEIK
jgi:2-C-methyl-D-erythritol 4-phosphate cytidylyltransferase